MIQVSETIHLMCCEESPNDFGVLHFELIVHLLRNLGCGFSLKSESNGAQSVLLLRFNNS